MSETRIMEPNGGEGTELVDPEAVDQPASALKKIRISLYLEPETLDALDRQILEHRRRTGRKRDRSDLISEAILEWLDRNGQDSR